MSSRVQFGCTSFFFLLLGMLASLIPSSVSALTLAEALDTTNLVWTTGGNANWFAQTTNTHDGIDAVRNGIINSNESSWIETAVMGPATITFWIFDSLGNGLVNDSLTINGEPRFHGAVRIGMSGGWGQDVLDVAPGTNTLRWTTAGYAPAPGAPIPPFWPPGNTNANYFALDEVVVLPPRPLAFAEQPEDEAVYPNYPWVWFSADAVGSPPLLFQWQFNGTNISGATNRYLHFDVVTTNDAGFYSVIVSNSQGVIVSTNATLTILPPTAPTFVYQQGDVTAYTGQELTFEAEAIGSPPFYYQWRKNGIDIPGANGTNAYGSYGGGYGGGPRISVTLSGVSVADVGDYSVVVSNSVSSIESTNATLTVVQSVLPVFGHQPRSLEVAAGVNTWLSAVATGTPEPSFTWTHLEAPPPTPPDPSFPPYPPTEIIPIRTGPPGSTFRSFYNVSPTNAGTYFITASNYAGAVVRDARLTVLPPIANLGSWTEGAKDIFVTNGRAYLAQGTNGLAILGVVNPAAPQLRGRFQTAGDALSVHVAGGMAFVAEGTTGIQIINITNPANPTLAGSYNTVGLARDGAVRSNLLFVADGDAGLLILNVSNPASPSVVGSFTTNFNASRICLSGNVALLSSSALSLGGGQISGLLIVDISNPAHPVEISRWFSSYTALAVQREMVFAAESSLQILSISNAAQSSVVGSFTYYPSTNSGTIIGIPSFPGLQIQDVFAMNDLAYLLGSQTNLTSLYVLDIRDPSEPVPVGYYALPGAGQTLWVEGQRTYLAGPNLPVTILGTPFNPLPDSPPVLSLAKQGGMQLSIQGRRGRHFTIESAAALTGFPWQPVQTLLLTNENAVLDMPVPTGTKFYRAKQLD